MGDLLIQKTVPAEECERFANALTGRECRCDPSKLYTISVRAHGVAEQHQGEPVAWLAKCKQSGLVEQAEPNEKASNPEHWTDAFPVYDSPKSARSQFDYDRGFAAGTAECETLRSQLADLEKLHGGELGLPKEGWPKYHKRKMETLRNLTAGYYERKLAERDALLREKDDVLMAVKEQFDRHGNIFPDRFDSRVFRWVNDAVASASAEPSASTEREAWALQEEKRLGIERLPVEPCAPVEIDERAAFEAWAKEQGLSVSRTPQALCFYNGMRRATGDYIDLSSLCSYAAWQARAALERKP